MSRTLFLALLLAPACSEYQLEGQQPPIDGIDHTSEPAEPPEEPSIPPEQTVPHEGGGTSTEWPVTVPCDGFDTNWQWWGSMPYGGPSDWADPSGVPFYEPHHQLTDYSTVQLPGRNIPADMDKSYVAWFDLPDPPPPVLLELQSDDGIWLYVNGDFVGHWGGNWQEEGCVNDNASCTERVAVPPIEITDHLLPGANVIAARVSNAVAGSWFEVRPHCID